MPFFIAEKLWVKCLYHIGLSPQRNPSFPSGILQENEIQHIHVTVNSLNIRNMMFGSSVAIDTAFTPASNDLRQSPGRLTSSHCGQMGNRHPECPF